VPNSKQASMPVACPKAGLGPAIASLAAVVVLVPLSTTLAAPAEARGAIYNLDIPAETLGDALQAFALESQHKLLYSSKLVAGLHFAGLKGEYTTEEAIKRLLSGTNLVYKITSDGLVVIRGADPHEASNGSIASSYTDSSRLRFAQASGTSPTALGDEFSKVAQASDQISGPTKLSAQSGIPASGRLEEIVVTAQKRTEGVDRVPISMAVFDRSALDRQGVRDISDVLQQTPGVDYSASGPLNSLTIRGISGGNSGSSTAGIYIDDVPIQIRYPTGGLVGEPAPKVFDLSRVEILRGPQGTYFGAGAEAGAIRFITEQPSVTDGSGYARADLNAMDNGGIGYEAGLAVGGPVINDVVGYRVSFDHERVGGWIDHYSTIRGGVREAASNWSDTNEIKAALLVKPTEHLEITPQFFYQDIYTNDNSSFDPALSKSSTNTFVNPSLLRTPYTDVITLPQLKMVYEAGDVALTSVTAYLSRRSPATLDYTDVIPALLGLPVSAYPTSTADFTASRDELTQSQTSEELRLQNINPKDRLRWVAGLWFSHADEHSLQTLIEPNLNNYLSGTIGKDVLQVFGSPLLPGGVSFTGINRLYDKQLAGFTQLDWEVIARLTLTAGVRVARQTSRFWQTQQGPLSGGGAQSSGSESELVTTPKYGASFQLDDKSLIYVSVTKGNRIGGANAPLTLLPACVAQLAAFGIPSPPTGYKSDLVWNYEIGAKSRLLDDRLQIEASAFHMNWNALQQEIYVPACASGIIANVGKAVSNGFDLQINFIPVDNVKTGLAVGYSDAKIAQTIGVPGTTSVIVRDDEQINPSDAPWQLTGKVEYDFAMAGGKPAYVRVDDEFHSRNPGPYASRDPNNVSYYPSGLIPQAQNLLNARFGILMQGWDVALYARNLLNNHPVLADTAPPVAAPLGIAYTLPSRMIGVTGSYHW